MSGTQDVESPAQDATSPETLEETPREEPEEGEDDEIHDIFADSDHKSRRNDAGLSGESAPATQLKPRKPAANAAAALDDQISALTRHAGQLKLTDALAGQAPAAGRAKDKGARATSEQVLDNRTRLILLQLLNRGVVAEVHGCVSTGKEANVYHAVAELSSGGDDGDGGDGGAGDRPAQRAIKVYKTSILQFKARAKYVAGDFRFQGGYNKSSSRAMVRQWAEKEMRNLRRIHAAGIPCPAPVTLRFHVLVMGFLGDRKGVAAPRLKDVVLEGDDVGARWRDLYARLLGYVRRLYNECSLVHADLSEYNVLYHADELYLIDVGQSVEHDHPESLNFLRADLRNVNDFFGRRGVEVVPERTVFDFVTSKDGPASIAALLSSSEGEQRSVAEHEVDAEVFHHQHIPRTLQEIDDVEGQAAQLAGGGTDAAVYDKLLASAAAPGARPDEGERRDSSSDNESDGSGGVGFDAQSRTPRGKRFEDKDAKRAHKHQVKEEKREQRRTKMPKHVKKRLVRESAHKKH